MKFPLKVEKRLFIGMAVSFLIISIALLVERLFFVGICLLLISGIIIVFYFKDYQKKKKVIDQDDKPKYVPQHKLFSPCNM
jgi:hypothetical protein